MKHINFAKLTLVVAAVLMISNLAFAQLTIDNFSTGPYQKTLKTGTDTNTQTGSMLGDSRLTIFTAAGMSEGVNPFDQPSSFQIKPKSKSAPSALILNNGYKTDSFLTVGYGYGSPMTVDLSSSYDRIRFYFDGTNQIINFNVELWSSGEEDGLGCNIIAPAFMQPFTVDFPFANFVGTADLTAVVNILVEIGVSEGANSELDLGMTSIQAVQGGQADVTCSGT